VPIVHETGGLKDSVRPYSDFDGIGDGFSFSGYEAKELLLAIQDAVKLFFGNEKKFAELRKRAMTKDFTWDKSAQQYQRMYTEICDTKESKPIIPFETAFDTLKKTYMKVDAHNKKVHPERIDENYHRVVQIRFSGRAEGTIHVEFSKGELHVEPTSYAGADAYIECSYDNLLKIASGKISSDTLFINGQLKISGNMSKSHDLRNLLAPQK